MQPNPQWNLSPHTRPRLRAQSRIPDKVGKHHIHGLLQGHQDFTPGVSTRQLPGPHAAQPPPSPAWNPPGPEFRSFFLQAGDQSGTLGTSLLSLSASTSWAPGQSALGVSTSVTSCPGRAGCPVTLSSSLHPWACFPVSGTGIIRPPKSRCEHSKSK